MAQVQQQQQQYQQAPPQQQQSVIINLGANDGKSQAAPQNVRDWSTGICGCFEDCGGCIFAYFLFQCYLCQLATRLQESCCVPLFLQGGLMAMRVKLRVLYGINGSICTDWCCSTYCPQLMACQLDREMRHCGI